MLRLLATFLLSLLAIRGSAEESIRVAVAANFYHPLSKIVEAYQKNNDTSPDIVLIQGATGKLYAQIKNGAPYDAFFAADAARPQKLEAELELPESSRYTYAYGILALWQPSSESGDLATCLENVKVLALANPELAPYGLAASQTLDSLGNRPFTFRRVFGSNIAQTYSFVKTGAADAGFVSFSQIRSEEIPDKQFLKIDAHLHQPIKQQAIILSDKPEVARFMAFCRSEEAQAIILSSGYLSPEKGD